MKNYQFCLLLLVVQSFGVQCGCAGPTNNQARIIRWKLTCPNANSVTLEFNSERTNINGFVESVKFIGSQLKDTDDKTFLIIDHPGAEACHLIPQLLAQIYAACDTSLAQVCFVRPNSLEPDIFHSTIVSWKTPFDDPRNAGSAEYFFDGKSVGSGDQGFEQMLKLLARAAPRAIVLVGSRHTTARAFADEELPFEPKKEKLKAILESHRILQMHPTYMFFSPKQTDILQEK